jgi:hypothetical protein
MNAKQTIPIIAKIAPPLLFGVAIYYGLKWLFSADDTEKKPEIKPTDTETEFRRKEVETTGFRPIPAEIPAKPAAAPVPAVFPPFSASVPAPQKIVAQVPPPPIISAVTAPGIPLPAQKKFISREDMAKIFNGGARALTRTGAVTALKSLGFGKSAAYDALSVGGRFSDWLQIAPDGIIAWTDR